MSLYPKRFSKHRENIEIVLTRVYDNRFSTDISYSEIIQETKKSVAEGSLSCVHTYTNLIDKVDENSDPKDILVFLMSYIETENNEK